MFAAPLMQRRYVPDICTEVTDLGVCQCDPWRGYTPGRACTPPLAAGESRPPARLHQRATPAAASLQTGACRWRNPARAQASVFTPLPVAIAVVVKRVRQTIPRTCRVITPAIRPKLCRRRVIPAVRGPQAPSVYERRGAPRRAWPHDCQGRTRSRTTGSNVTA